MLSRRDRAALALALECCRAREDLSAKDALDAGPLGGTGDDLLYAYQCAMHRGVSRRVLFARLALALRVLLRADAGDFGEVACERCGFVGDGTHEAGEPCGLCWQRCVEPVPRYRPRQFRPLWEVSR